MEPVAEDPLVSVPIVCGEFMRATGFFYSTAGRVYLVTARHNVLPTLGSDLYSGEIATKFETAEYLPEIDVYLRHSTGFDVAQLDIRKQPGVIQSPKIDIIAVPINIDPGEYGYHIWACDDLASPIDSPSSFDLIGFNGDAFPRPDATYSTTDYQAEIRRPRCLPLVNELTSTNQLRGGFFAQCIDEELVGNDDVYNGLSGAPVLGEGLVGIHSHTTRIPKAAANQFDDDFVFCVYSRADVLPYVLD